MDLKWRLIATVASLVLALLVNIIWGFGWAFVFWLVFVVFVVGYFLLGTISAASERLNFGDLDGAERILGYTKFPKLLLKMNQAYFKLLQGMIAMQRKDSVKGEALLQEAYDIGLPTDNDRAMVLLNLAYSNHGKRKFQVAKGQLRQIKEMDITDITLLTKVAELEQALKVNPNGMQSMMYGGGRGGRAQQRMIRQDGATQKKTNNRKSSSKRKKKKKK
ncbi:MAG: hypothetical protein ACPG19_09040 [Saprospiraceae bacterium]